MNPGSLLTLIALRRGMAGLRSSMTWHQDSYAHLIRAGNVPPKADLGQLQGLEAIAAGSTDVPMINGGKFDGAKAYKDSKVGGGICKLASVAVCLRIWYSLLDSALSCNSSCADCAMFQYSRLPWFV